jgi:hypothetical protein
MKGGRQSADALTAKSRQRRANFFGADQDAGKTIWCAVHAHMPAGAAR